MIALKLLWLLVPMTAGCGLMFHDKGSDVIFTGVSLVYTEWVAPAESNWQKDSYECTRDAQEVVPTYFGRLFGRTQVHAERCMEARGYMRR
jgi:hypothetical protein